MAAIVSYRNYVDSAATVLTAGAGESRDGYPLSNLKLRGLGQFALFDLVSGFFAVDVDFGESRTVNLIAALGIRLDTSAFSQLTSITLYTSSDGIAYAEYEEQVTSDAGENKMPGIEYLVVPGGVTSRYFRVEVAGSELANPEGFARLWMDDGLLLKNKVLADARFGADDAGQLDKTDGQQYVAFERPRTKRSEFTFRGLSTLEAWGFEENSDAAGNVPSFNGLQFVAGATGEVIIIPKITDTPARNLWIRRTSIYGHLAEPPTIDQDGNSEQWSAGVRAIEER